MALHKSLRIAAVLSFFTAALTAIPQPAFAACTSPDGIAGGITWNGTDSVIWCDGSNWYRLKDAASGGSAAAAGSTGQIQFNNGSNVIAADPGLTWDNTNKRLGIGVAAPSASLGVKASVGQTADLLDIALSGGSSLLNVASVAPGSNATGVVTIYDRGVGKSGDGAILSVHADDQSPYLAKFYNEMYSATDPVFTYYADNSGTMMQGTETARALQFYTSGLSNIRMTISANGNVGIGTATPGASLETTGDILLANGKTYNIKASTGTAIGILNLDGSDTLRLYAPAVMHLHPDVNAATYINYNNTGDVIVGDGTNSTRFLVQKGNVGIGTASPGQKLSVAGSILAANGADTTSTARNAGMYLWSDTAFGAELHYGQAGQSAGWATAIYGRTADTTAIRFGTYPGSSTAQSAFSEKMTLLSNGRVGIGTVAPATALEVNGTVTATAFAGDGSALTGISGADNLGNHTATTTLALGGNALTSSAGTVIDGGGGWHRTYGNTGWYNGTHGGGWYMTDSTWVRTYNSKSIYTPSNIQADGTITAGAFSGDGASISSLNASNLVSGTVPTARLGSGTANSTTYLRGDGTWATPSSGAAGSNGHVQFNNSGALGGDSALFWDNTNKRLGVATASPTAKLHVVGGGRFTTTSGTALMVSASGGSSAIGISGSASGGTSFNVGVYGSNGATGGRGVHGANAIASGYGVYGENVDNTGYGVYCSSSNASGCGGNQAWTNTSDVRLKRDIHDVEPQMGLDAIMRLRPVTYHWRMGDTTKLELGFIAQEVEKVFPQVVGTSPDVEITNDDGSKQTITRVKSLSYATIVVPLVKAVQELKAANDNHAQYVAMLLTSVAGQAKEIQALIAADDNLQAENSDLRATIDSLSRTVKAQGKAIEALKAVR